MLSSKSSAGAAASSAAGGGNQQQAGGDPVAGANWAAVRSIAVCLMCCACFTRRDHLLLTVSDKLTALSRVSRQEASNMFDAIISGAQPQQLGGAGAFNLFGAPNQQVRARGQYLWFGQSQHAPNRDSQQCCGHLTRTRFAPKASSGDVWQHLRSCHTILGKKTNMRLSNCMSFRSNLSTSPDLLSQGANAQLGGELLLPIVARYLDQLRNPDTSARLMPSASYSLPEGRCPAQSTAKPDTHYTCHAHPLRGLMRAVWSCRAAVCKAQQTLSTAAAARRVARKS